MERITIWRIYKWFIHISSLSFPPWKTLKLSGGQPEEQKGDFWIAPLALSICHFCKLDATKVDYLIVMNTKWLEWNINKFGLMIAFDFCYFTKICWRFDKIQCGFQINVEVWFYENHPTDSILLKTPKDTCMKSWVVVSAKYSIYLMDIAGVRAWMAYDICWRVPD